MLIEKSRLKYRLLSVYNLRKIHQIIIHILTSAISFPCSSYFTNLRMIYFSSKCRSQTWCWGFNLAMLGIGDSHFFRIILSVGTLKTERLTVEFLSPVLQPGTTHRFGIFVQLFNTFNTNNDVRPCYQYWVPLIYVRRQFKWLPDRGDTSGHEAYTRT